MPKVPLNQREQEYLDAVTKAIADDPRSVGRWATVICPECDEQPTPDDGLHVLADNGIVAIGCEGYWVINPNAVGITNPNWCDWYPAQPA